VDPRRSWRITFSVALLIQVWALYVPKTPGVQTDLPVDKVVHFLLFALVTWLGVRGGIPARWLAPLMLLQAAASELVQQLWLSQRGGDMWDFVADVLGIAAGLLLARGATRSSESVPRVNPGDC
jgi:hypothetical protein